jgi:hypothetical protein
VQTAATPVHEASAVSSPAVSEAALLEIIQHRLSPADQTRLTYLRRQNETGIISDLEHQELLRYVDRIEQLDSDRAEALIKLAQLRQVDLEVLVAEFLPTHSQVI